MRDDTESPADSLVQINSIQFDARLRPILDAELAAGNAVVRVHVDPGGRFVVSLERPFCEIYGRVSGSGGGGPAGSGMQGVQFSEVRDARASYFDDWYETDDAAIGAPAMEPAALAQLVEKAQREGRLLAKEQWAAGTPGGPSVVSQSSSVKADRHKAAGRIADLIEMELRRIGEWQDRPPAPEAFEFRRAFAGDTMAFTQWIQFVLLPRLREIAKTKAGMPPDSQVGAYAAREFDGAAADVDRLMELLRDVDALATAGSRTGFGSGGAGTGPRDALWPKVILGTTLLAWAAGALAITYYATHFFADRSAEHLTALSDIRAAGGSGWRGVTVFGGGTVREGRWRFEKMELLKTPTMGGPSSADADLSVDLRGSEPKCAIGRASPAEKSLSEDVAKEWLERNARSISPKGGNAGAAEAGGDESSRAVEAAAVVGLVKSVAAAGDKAAFEAALGQFVRAMGGKATMGMEPVVTKRPPSVPDFVFVGVFAVLFVPPSIWFALRVRKWHLGW